MRNFIVTSGVFGTGSIYPLTDPSMHCQPQGEIFVAKAAFSALNKNPTGVIALKQ